MVEVCRLEASLDRFGDRLPGRILSADERREFAATACPAHFLARRFAAKEAVSKALGTGFRNGFFPSEIGIGHDPLGRPFLDFSPRAKALLDGLGVTRTHVSITDENEYALAYVLLESGSSA